jgi:hypothetical protein
VISSERTPPLRRERGRFKKKIEYGIYPLTHNGTCVISSPEGTEMQKNSVKVNDEFMEIGTRAIDDRNRLTIGELLKGSKRVRLYKNNRGEVLVQPVVEIPASELWLFQDKEALENVKKGLKDVAEGRISKLNLDEL